MEPTLVGSPLREDMEDGKSKDSQLRQVLAGNLAKPGNCQEPGTSSSSSAAVVGIVLGEDPYTGAAIKLEELFFYWLSQKETVEMVEGYVSAVMQGHPPPLEMTAEATSIALRSLNVASHSQLLLHGSNQPPRSPTAASVSSSPPSSSLFRRSFLDPNALVTAAASSSSSSSSSSNAPSSPSPSGRSDTTPETSAKLVQESSVPPRQQQQQQQFGHVCTSPSSARPAAAARLPTCAALPPLPIGRGGSGGRGKGYPEDSLEERRAEIEAVVTAASSPAGVLPGDLTDFTRRLARLPSFLKKLLHRRVRQLYYGDILMESSPSDAAAAAAAAERDEPVSLEAMLRFWREEMEPYDSVDRLFRLLKQPQADFLVKEDLAPVLSELLVSHPGLEFLRSHPDFQQKYALTVTTRIFYALNRSGSGRITPREMRRSKLLDAMRFVDENEDINKETRFFSYEHFYVLYCRFWELDTDRDGFLLREDLLKYGQHSLSSAIVDRIFEVGPRPFSDGRGGRRKCADKMAYEDFIYFMLSEEDKGNEASLRYWFECVDVDGDGRVTFQEMRAFYSVQLQRMEWLGHELVPFEDVLAQMLDMLKPSDRQRGLVIEDFLVPDRIRIAGVFFDALFNLNKFIQFEQRDPFGDRQKREDPFDNDWERFAYRDYQQLAMDEEENDGYAEELDGHVSNMDVDEAGPEWSMSDEYDMGFDSQHFSSGKGGNGSSSSGNENVNSGANGSGSSEAPF